MESDVFISHAGEDKAEVAEPLARLLRAAGVRVWLDKSVLRLGDKLSRKIDEGLVGCRFGVVVLSPKFFSKAWPQRELQGLVQKEMETNRKVILPVWHKVTRGDIVRYSPPLADLLAASTSDGLDHVARLIKEVLDDERGARPEEEDPRPTDPAAPPSVAPAADADHGDMGLVTGPPARLLTRDDTSPTASDVESDQPESPAPQPPALDPEAPKPFATGVSTPEVPAPEAPEPETLTPEAPEAEVFTRELLELESLVTNRRSSRPQSPQLEPRHSPRVPQPEPLGRALGIILPLAVVGLVLYGAVSCVVVPVFRFFHTTPAESHVARGNEHLENDDVDRAIDEFKQAVSLDPNDARPYTRLAAAHLSRETGDQSANHQAAMAAARRAIELDADEAEPHLYLARALLGEKRIDEAITEYERAKDLSGQWDYWYELATVYQARAPDGQAGKPDHERAVVLLEKAESRATTYMEKWNTYSKLSSSYDKLGRKSKSDQMVLKIFQLNREQSPRP